VEGKGRNNIDPFNFCGNACFLNKLHQSKKVRNIYSFLSDCCSMKITKSRERFFVMELIFLSSKSLMVGIVNNQKD